MVHLAYLRVHFEESHNQDREAITGEAAQVDFHQAVGAQHALENQRQVAKDRILSEAAPHESHSISDVAPVESHVDLQKPVHRRLCRNRQPQPNSCNLPRE